MADSASSPFFSIIIPTRDRPEVFQEALQSVVGQTFSDREILVIVDGSSEENLEKYRLIQEQQPKIQFHFLAHQPNGHGQSYSMNVGSREALGRYICFLDDDDSWTDPQHLESAHSSLSATPLETDVYYSNQRGYHSDGRQETDPVWLEELIPEVSEAEEHINDTYLVDARFILRSKGFAHLNCSIFLKSFYLSIGGMDETIRYENDRDVFIRSIDQAKKILYSTHYISRHNIPDGSKKLNLSTVASDIEKKLYQLRVYDKGVCLCKKPEVRQHCKMGKTYELKHMTRIFAEQEDYPGAAFYARQALMIGFNVRWFLYTLYLGMRSSLSSKRT
jgi:glycosyltransferase involved in cell wall biosynthesis